MSRDKNPRPTRRLTIELDSSLPADRVVAAGHDFTDRRIEIWPSVQRKHFRVHSIAGTFADVTEGTNLFPIGPWFNWERCDYDWSQPGVVVATMTDSNYAVSPSGWELRATPTAGGSHIELTWIRTLRSDLRGGVFDFLFSRFGRSLFGRDARKMLRRLQRSEDRLRVAAA